MALEHGESVAGASKKKSRIDVIGRVDPIGTGQQRGESSFTGVNEPGVAAFFERFRGACDYTRSLHSRAITRRASYRLFADTPLFTLLSFLPGTFVLFLLPFLFLF